VGEAGEDGGSAYGVADELASTLALLCLKAIIPNILSGIAFHLPVPHLPLLANVADVTDVTDIPAR
jgi:hypothetical protein